MMSEHALKVDGLVAGYGETTVIRPGKQYEELASNKLDGQHMASPAVFENSLLLRTNTHLYRIGQ